MKHPAMYLAIICWVIYAVIFDGYMCAACRSGYMYAPYLCSAIRELDVEVHPSRPKECRVQHLRKVGCEYEDPLIPAG